MKSISTCSTTKLPKPLSSSAINSSSPTASPKSTVSVAPAAVGSSPHPRSSRKSTASTISSASTIPTSPIKSVASPSQHLPEIAEWSRELLAKHRAIANEFLTANPALETEPLTAGTVIFPKVSVPVDQLCQLLRNKYETIITPGHFFGAPNRIRIGIGGETATFTEGLARIQSALKSSEGSKVNLRLPALAILLSLVQLQQ